MASINELLDAVRDVTKTRNDSELARRLGITPNAVNNYRHGRAAPNAVVCAKIAEITGIRLAKVLGIVGETRAISQAEKAVWRQLASAAIVVLAMLPALAQAHHTANMNSGLYMHYAKFNISRSRGIA